MKRGSQKNRFVDFYIGIPFLALASMARKKNDWPSHVRRIGLLPNPALGDTLLCSGPIFDVREAFPSAEIVLFATAANTAAAKLLPGINEIRPISVTNPLDAIRRVRHSGLDLFLDFTSWQRVTAFIATLSGARFVVGYSTPGQFRHYGYDRAATHRRDRHELENQRDIVRAIGIPPTHEPRVVIPPGCVYEPPPGISDIVVFHAWPSGARSWLREWPQNRWVELAKALNRPGRLFLLTGSPQEFPRSAELRDTLRREGIAAEVFAGRDGLAGVASLLVNASLLVSVNTGIMHLGAILGTPTVSINGPTSDLRWGPVGTRVANINPPDGSGGFLHLGFEFAGNPTDTMQRITTDQALEASLAVLANSAKRS